MRAHKKSKDSKLDEIRLGQLYKIGQKMLKTELPADFVNDAVEMALHFDGVYDLMIMWSEEADKKERGEMIADIQELIEDARPDSKNDWLTISLNDLEQISGNIRAFKDSLLQKVDEFGGMTELSKKCGIPQPSLSRFFNSSSIPRRSTLLKIGSVLGIGKIEIPLTK